MKLLNVNSHQTHNERKIAALAHCAHRFRIVVARIGAMKNGNESMLVQTNRSQCGFMSGTLVSIATTVCRAMSP